MASEFFETPKQLSEREANTEFDAATHNARFAPAYISNVFGPGMGSKYTEVLGKLSMPPQDFDTVQVLSEVEGYKTYPPEEVCVNAGTEGVVVIADEEGCVVEVLDEEGSTAYFFNAPASLLKVTNRHRFDPNRDW